MVLKEYSGNAAATRLASGLAQGATTNFAVITGGGSGYPTGASAPFVVVIDPDTAFEEKILVTTRSGDTFSTLSRGYDNTTDQAHSAQAEVKHVWDAISATEVIGHANNTTGNVHPQYVLDADLAAAAYLTTGTHDLAARHTFTVLGSTPAAGTTISQTAAAAGTSEVASRDDHVHPQAAATPRGLLGRTAHTTDVELTGSFADIVSVVVTLVAGRAYKVSGALQTFLADTGDNYIEVKLMEGATTYGRGSTQNGAFSTISDRIEMSAVVTGTGSTTFKFQALRGTTPSTSAAIRSTTAPGHIMVEDIGVA